MTAAPPQRPRMTFAATVLDAPDARELAGFYRALLGWETVDDEPGWARLKPPGGGAGLSFQTEPHYSPPVWPSEAGAQQMMLHLDFGVTELEAATAHAVACGATVAAKQPQDGVRVLFDPAGHPFCLFLPGH
ncbi:VOC family protein [Streptomyces tsukubensis]|uniref:Glyoxalase n=1 Tax=Streptomyces tsukubensis TaxID=83656 RepID=A0A1V4AFJ6_9ACTN|nr:VOC family protein [Streptomyces tsukubensis]OON82327.1 glyoxalase [Streptomyces tsukubensis]QFR92821.1 VOC family protein [Streptomyces tsukubensis]